MDKSYLPSKQFIRRGVIATLLLVVTLSIQSAWFKNLVKKKLKSSNITPITVGDIVTKDSNGNGIMDWEEKLWGLDPAILYTNGISNKQIIEDKKKTLGISTTTPEGNLNDTDRLARELFTLTTALGQSGEVDSATLRGIAGKLGDSIDIKKMSNKYSLKDIKTTKTSIASLNSYYDNLMKILGKYTSNTGDIDVVISALENGDTGRLGELSQTALTYKKLSKELTTLSVPVGVTNYHLSIINGLYGVAESFGYLGQMEDNAVASLLGVALYKGYSEQISNAVTGINDYLTSYGILQ